MDQRKVKLVDSYIRTFYDDKHERQFHNKRLILSCKNIEDSITYIAKYYAYFVSKKNIKKDYATKMVYNLVLPHYLAKIYLQSLGFIHLFRSTVTKDRINKYFEEAKAKYDFIQNLSLSTLINRANKLLLYLYNIEIRINYPDEYHPEPYYDNMYPNKLWFDDNQVIESCYLYLDYPEVSVYSRFDYYKPFIIFGWNDGFNYRDEEGTKFKYAWWERIHPFDNEKNKNYYPHGIRSRCPIEYNKYLSNIFHEIPNDHEIMNIPNSLQFNQVKQDNAENNNHDAA